jgi:hypothetical protein
MKVELSPWRELLDNPSVCIYKNLVISFPFSDISPEHIQCLGEKIRAFVKSGGCLIDVDDPSELFTGTFSNKFPESKSIKIEKTSLTAGDPLLVDQVGVGLVEKLSGETALLFQKQPDMNPIVQVHGKDDLLAGFSFPFEKGFVIFCGLPLGLLENEQQDKFFSYLIYSGQTHFLQNQARERQHLERADIVTQRVFMMIDIPAPDPITFSLPSEQNALVMLGWEGDARLHLHIEDEQHHMALDHSSDRSPIVWGASLPGGEWHCQVSIFSLKCDVVPVLLTIFSTPPLLRRKFPQTYASTRFRIKHCRYCHMPLNPSMLFCPACGKKVEDN